MEDKRQVVSISLPKKSLVILNKICQTEEKTRSEVIRGLIRKYLLEKEWQKIFAWGSKTAKKFKIKSEKDILRIIND